MSDLYHHGPGQSLSPDALASDEVEQALLVALMSDEWRDAALGAVDETLFHRAQHLEIYHSIQRLMARNEIVDPVTIWQDLKDRGMPGDWGALIHDLYRFDGIGGRAWEGYARIARSYALKRQLYGAGIELIERLKTEPPEVVRESVCSRLMGAQAEPARGPQTFAEIFVSHGPEMERRFNSQGHLDGLSTGFSALDSRLKGLKKQDFIVLAARPSMGKTTLALNIAENVALSGEGVLVFSMEMSAPSLLEKMISSVGGVPLEEIQTGAALHNPEQCDQFRLAVLRLRSSGIAIDDRAALSVTEMHAAALGVKRKLGKLGLIVVDYIGLAKGEGQTRNDEVSSISRGLKQLAKTLDIPVIGIAQLNREVEKRQDKRPMMSDLRDSGAIEQDADLIAFIYRDEYYNPESPQKGVTEVIWSKFRKGKIGTDYLGWQGDKSRFVNLERGYRAPEPSREIKPRRGMTL